MTGIIAACLYSIGQESWTYLASAVLAVSILLDRADGVFARLSGKISSWGHKYDLFADTICNSLAFAGIGIGLRDSELGLWSVFLGIIAGLSISTVLYAVTLIEKKKGRRAAELGDFLGFDVDDAMFCVPLATALGWEYHLIVAAAVGATLFAIFFCWKFLFNSD